METVLVESKQKNVEIKKSGRIGFKYTFKDKPIEIPKNIAEIIIENSNFKIVKGSKKNYDSSLDLDGDGDVDKDDRSIAGRVLASGRKKKKSSGGD